MSRLKRTSLSTARLVALPLVSFATSVAPECPARAAPPALSAASSVRPTRPSRQAPLTLRFADLDPISGEDPDLPAKLLDRYPGETVTVVYQVCVQSDGTVMSTNRRSGVADADVDAVVVRTLRTWRYPEQPANTMTCMLLRFDFSR